MIAAAEVIGRHAVERVPVGDVRARVGRWTRRSSRSSTVGGLDGGGVTVAALADGIVRAGVERGRDLVVHSSWAGMNALRAKPGDVVAMLRELVGVDATLLMPAHPVEKFESGAYLYDVDKTPTRMGMLSETFRRQKDVRRSPLPIAPVCAVGPAGDEYTRDYFDAAAGTPWGRGSPWFEIGERRGQVLVLGVDFIRSLTLLHVAFDVLGAANPIADYYEGVDAVVTSAGATRRLKLRRQRRSLERHLATFAFRRLIMRAGLARVADVGGIAISVIDAKNFLDWHLPLAQATGLPYWGFTRART